MTFGKPKGYVFIKAEITYSKKPPQLPFPPFNDFDTAEDYFNALQGKMVQVMDIAVDGSSYLVFGKGEKSGGFIWDIDKRDTSGDMVPYKFFHPEADIDDVISFLKMKDCDCANFMNQAAIDEVVRKHNQDFGEELYTEGYNVCLQCRGQPLMAGVHRICFKAK